MSHAGHDPSSEMLCVDAEQAERRIDEEQVCHRLAYLVVNKEYVIIDRLALTRQYDIRVQDDGG